MEERQLNRVGGARSPIARAPRRPLPLLSSLAGLALIFSLPALSVHAQESTCAADASCVAADPEVQGAERLFSAWLEAQIAYRGLPGVAVGVVSDQKLIWSKGFGYANMQTKAPMTPSTKFRMASNSKLFAAIAIMQLREDGKLRLDDPVVKYLPWFKPKAAGDDDGPITIEQLLSHSSGLPREASDYWVSWQFPTREEFQKLAEQQAPFAPSVRWKYSNLAFAVAGMVVENVSGQTWDNYVKANILDPLEMRETSVDQNVPGLATPYGRRMPDGTREVLPFMDSRGMAAATGITSTVEDMAKFMSAQVRRGPRKGSQIVSSGSWREMLRVRSVSENWTSGTGLGFDVGRVANRTYVGHSGGYPGYTTQTLIQLDDKVGVIVLTNTNDSNPGEIAQQLMATVGKAAAKAAATKPPEVAWDPAWARFAGLYRSRPNDQQVVLLNKRLVLFMPGARSLDEPTALRPLGGGRFRVEGGEVVRFREESGKPMRMYVGEGWLDRVSGP